MSYDYDAAHERYFDACWADGLDRHHFLNELRAAYRAGRESMREELAPLVSAAVERGYLAGCRDGRESMLREIEAAIRALPIGGERE